MSKIKNGGLDQYGTEPFEPQQFGTAGVEGVKSRGDLASEITACGCSIVTTRTARASEPITAHERAPSAISAPFTRLQSEIVTEYDIDYQLS